MEQLERGCCSPPAQGMSWARIVRGMSLGSAQAALQRFDRLAGRVQSRSEF
jgi:hypothetical protein